MPKPAPVKIEGLLGLSAQRKVFLGFAPAGLLHSISFADVLDEDSARGYQRRFNPQHSLDFLKYIKQANSSTIPLTFNLRPRSDQGWAVKKVSESRAVLEIQPAAGKVLAQVDCQHRLGYLTDLQLTLPFMCFLGLTVREEMEIFNIINGKAKGLSTSLLDFHDATLSSNLATERPELFIALQLNSNSESPWYQQLDLGGASTSGLKRRASLRTMQKAIKRFLTQTRILDRLGTECAARFVLNFWASVCLVLREAWENPRRHLLSKGVGVYALMTVAGDLYQEAPPDCPFDRSFFVNQLSDFSRDVDWSTAGPLSGFGGEGGVKAAVSFLRNSRGKTKLKVVSGG